MISFKPVTLEDKEIITSYTIPFAPKDCDFSISNLCSWHFSNDSSYAIVNDFLVVRFRTEDDRQIYLMPIGQGDARPVIRMLEEDARREGQLFRLQGEYTAMREILEKDFPTLFRYQCYREYYDYIYLRKDLAELKGKNYQPKRNHVNKFKKEYAYRYTPITPEMLPQCLEFEARWCLEHGQAGQETIRQERRALTFCLEHYEELGLTGGAIWVGEEMAAFTFGAPVNRDTFDVNVEKANTRIDGAYSLINQEFAGHLPESYIYLNREEDLGVAGLRQSKLSYHPAVLYEKCIATKEGL